MKYKLGTTFLWKDTGIRNKYGIRLAGYREDTQQYVIEWTALESGVESRALGEKWNSSWGVDAIDSRMDLLKPVYNLPEDLFEL